MQMLSNCLAPNQGMRWLPPSNGWKEGAESTISAAVCYQGGNTSTASSYVQSDKDTPYASRGVEDWNGEQIVLALLG